MSKISIIIPVYNKEEYIKDCLQSIVNQTYKNIEIIIINDGSTDNSKNIIDQFSKLDDRIKVVNTSNKGAGSARNTGLEIATGDYISFIDADDIITLDYMETMYNALVAHDADIAECRYKRIKSGENLNKNNNKHVFYQISNIDKLKILYGENEKEHDNSVIIPNKVFKKEIFDDIRYPLNKVIDDEFITYKIIIKSKKIVITDDIMYGYVQSANSVMRKNYEKKRAYDTIEVYEEVYDYFKNIEDLELIKLILKKHLFYCQDVLERTIASKVITKEEKNMIYILLKEKFTEKIQIYIKLVGKDDYYEKTYEKFYKTINNIL